MSGFCTRCRQYDNSVYGKDGEEDLCDKCKKIKRSEKEEFLKRMWKYEAAGLLYYDEKSDMWRHTDRKVASINQNPKPMNKSFKGRRCSCKYFTVSENSYFTYGSCIKVGETIPDDNESFKEFCPIYNSFYEDDDDD